MNHASYTFQSFPVAAATLVLCTIVACRSDRQPKPLTATASASSAVVRISLPSASLSATSPLAALSSAAPSSVLPRDHRPTYALARSARVTDLDREMKAVEARAQGTPGDWIHWEQLAQKALERAKLTGDYEDYGTASRALALAAQYGGGKAIAWVRANLAFTLHRLDEAEIHLDEVDKQALVPFGQRIGSASMRARLAYFRGDYDGALTRIEEIKPENRGAAEAIAEAEVLWHTGRAKEARGKLANAQSKEPKNAFLIFARGLLELEFGAYEAAQAYFQLAVTASPESWLFREHRAETLAKLGKTEDAEVAYRTLVTETEDPEFMDALADLLEARGDKTEPARLRDEATKIYDKRVAAFPEASAAHALSHYFQVAPKRTVELAERNAKARPYGDSQVQLARAYLVNDRAAEAKDVIERVLKTRWDTAELHKVASEIFDKVKDSRASAERARAKKLNPHIFNR
jgi:tetratricopeptide (TPR) repeat protein